MTRRTAHRLPPPAVAVLLFLATMLLYSPVRDFEFVQYDDPIYVLDNPSLQVAPSWSSVVRAFREPYETNWIPLTWLSLQLDHAWFGFDPAGYHLVNAALHAAAAGLLFLALTAFSGAPGPSLFVAAVFAAHPTHVESVAWISERKDVLSGFFFMCTILAYADYARRDRRRSRIASGLRLAGVTGLFTAGVLAKPMLVTLPFVLLVLDHWPLGRTRRGGAAAGFDWRRIAGLLAEKLPLFTVSAIVCVVTVRVQRAAGAVLDEPISPWIRLGNALESLGFYLTDSFWPHGLAVFYPHPGSALTAGRPAAVAAALLLVTGLCLRWRWTRPHCLVGWSWFGIMLLPVIGIVQAGMQARADRYLYLPQTGLAIAVAWEVRERWARTATGRRLCASFAAIAIAGLGLATWRQLPAWRDTRSLYERAIAVTADNFVAHRGLGAELYAEGDAVAAVRHYREAVRIRPRWAEAHVGLGDALLSEGDRAGAIRSYREGIRVAPRLPIPHLHLADALLADGRVTEAIEHFQRALLLSGGPPIRGARARYAAALLRAGETREAILQLRAEVTAHPDYAEARANLGLALIRVGRYAAAREQLEEALPHVDDSAEIHMGLATAAHRLGDSREAIEQYTDVLRLRPGWPVAANNLAWILATHPDDRIRDPRRAIALLDSLDSPPEQAAMRLDTLAAAYAAAGNFGRAIALARSAADLVRGDARPERSREIEERLAGYAKGRPFLDETLTGATAPPRAEAAANPTPPAPHSPPTR